MKVLLFFDQIQSGFGGSERPDVPLQVEKGGIGSYLMFERFMKEIKGVVVGTVVCGPQYFNENEELVKEKVSGLVKKLQVDAVLCGPCFHYKDYASMAARLAVHLNENTDTHAVVMCSKENTETIEAFKEEVPMIKMPKKGETGLNQSLQDMTKIIQAMVEDKPLDDFKESIY